MTAPTDPAKLQALLTMLDDPDENIAIPVMGELLRSENELLPLLSDLQEADNPVLRKRVHELQSIITMRRRRREFLQKLQRRPLDLIDGLLDVHLLWFEQDSKQSVFELLHAFMEVAGNNKIDSIEKLGSFMARSSFATPPDGELNIPENFCIGTVLEDRIGADIILCTLALLVGMEAGLELGLVQIMGHFAVINGEGTMITPANDWVPDKVSKLTSGDFWNDPAAVLKYASLMIFLYAVGSDSFRYVHTIGNALTGGDSDTELKFLPYPYNGVLPNQKRKEKNQ